MFEYNLPQGIVGEVVLQELETFIPFQPKKIVIQSYSVFKPLFIIYFSAVGWYLHQHFKRYTLSVQPEFKIIPLGSTRPHKARARAKKMEWVGVK